jgi:PmbA protein
MGVANSLGVFAVHRSTRVDASTVVMAPASSGWAQNSGWRLNAIDWTALAAEAIGKAKLGEKPRDLEAGTYTVILDPYATADVVDWLGMGGASAQAVQEERSWMNGRIHQKIMADCITIDDDGLDVSGIPMPFDFEGVPKQIVSIVERGVAKGPVYDSYTAGREAGKHSTGHATPPSPLERHGPMPMNLVLRPGSSSVEEMIRSTKLGVYITRFWYTRMVQPRDVIVTGMTRDGTFVIRDGEIAYPTKSLRFTQSYLEALLHTEAIGAKLKTLRSESGTTMVPAVKLAQFRFTSATS